MRTELWIASWHSIILASSRASACDVATTDMAVFDGARRLCRLPANADLRGDVLENSADARVANDLRSRFVLDPDDVDGPWPNLADLIAHGFAPRLWQQAQRGDGRLPSRAESYTSSVARGLLAAHTRFDGPDDDDNKASLRALKPAVSLVPRGKL